MRLAKHVYLLAVSILAGLLFLAPLTAQAQSSPADQYNTAAQQMMAAKNYTQAAQYYYAAVKADPNNFTAYQGLGNCYYMSGRKSDALTFYQRALSLQPGNAQLAQFVQNLQGQTTGVGAASPGAMGMTAADPLAQGAALFQQRQYAAAIPYFQRAAQQNPNDYRAYYYAGYSYYMTGNVRFAALYFAVANMKQPNASIQSYADRTKATLSPDDQTWVETQLAKYSASTGGSYSAPSKVVFGFDFLGGSSYFFSDPDQVINGVKAAQANNDAVSLGGATPNMVALIGVEPYLQFGQNFELDFGVGYVPVGSLSYTWLDITNGDGFQNSFSSSMVMSELGLKILFGDKDVTGYIGLGANISPISMTLTKLPTDGSGNLVSGAGKDPANGTYNTVAFGGYARFGLDFVLSKNMSLGPFIGIQVLTATNFQNGGNTLEVDQDNGDVGVANGGSLKGVTNTTALTLDYSNINFGAELKFSF